MHATSTGKVSFGSRLFVGPKASSQLLLHALCGQTRVSSSQSTWKNLREKVAFRSLPMEHALVRWLVSFAGVCQWTRHLAFLSWGFVRPTAGDRLPLSRQKNPASLKGSRDELNDQYTTGAPQFLKPWAKSKRTLFATQMVPTSLKCQEVRHWGFRVLSAKQTFPRAPPLPGLSSSSPRRRASCAQSFISGRGEGRGGGRHGYVQTNHAGILALLLEELCSASCSGITPP